MNDRDSMDEQLTRALERKPAAEVSADFAARVAAMVPVRKATRVPTGRYGLLAARTGMGVLSLALVAGAHTAGHTAFGVAAEWILCAELAGLAVWLSGAWKQKRAS